VIRDVSVALPVGLGAISSGPIPSRTILQTLSFKSGCGKFRVPQPKLHMGVNEARKIVQRDRQITISACATHLAHQESALIQTQNHVAHHNFRL
jgi:hypothetical protein